MLSIQPSKSAAAAKQYFVAHLASGDYYSQKGASPGLWFGQAAERLGLQGQVEGDAFLALANNRDPRNPGERLTVRDAANRRAGYDFCFSPPKSVSALWARTGDARLVEAVRQSILDTLTGDVEPEMQTRFRRNGLDTDVTVANVVGSLFLHESTRPLASDKMPDPQIHGHAYIHNICWADHEGRWQAGQFGMLKSDGRYFDATFLARLGARLRALGYTLERDDKGGWEIAGVPATVITKFSRRRYEEILPEAKRLGIEGDGEATGKLGVRTRQKKAAEPASSDAMHDYWNSRLTAREAAALDAVQAGSGNSGGSGPTAQKAMQHAIAHFFGPDGRDSAVAEKAILEEALRYGAGAVLPDELKAQLASHGDLIRADLGGRSICTTTAVLAEEQAVVEFARSGRSACAPLAAGKPVRLDTALSREQAAAVGQLLGSQDRVMLLIGKSGTGKSTTLKALDAALRERGKRLVAFAPTARASRGVLKAKGFATADTVQALLQKPALQESIRGNVVLIDEAGLAGTRALRQVFDLAGRLNARVLLVGDPQQHRGVPRGQVLNILQAQAGLQPARLNTIRRQTDPAYRQAVEALSEGRAQEGFDRLDALGYIREMASADERYRTLASDYADTLAAGRSAMIVSPTHAESNAVSAAVRAELKARGVIGADDRAFVRLEGKGLTEAQRQDAALYRAGDTVQWNQHGPAGFKRGDKVTVVDAGGGAVRVRNAAGQVKDLPLALADRFEVYRTATIGLAEGDKLRVTRNGFSADKVQHRLNNGDLLTVAGFTPAGDIIDARGWVIPASFGHLAYGVVTSHASQGQEAAEVFVAQSALSRGASSAQQFYVSAGRGEQVLRLYTDSKEALRAAVARSEVARSAAEVWQASQRQRLAAQSLERQLLTRRQTRRSLLEAARSAGHWLAAQARGIASAIGLDSPPRGFGHAFS